MGPPGERTLGHLPQRRRIGADHRDARRQGFDHRHRRALVQGGIEEQARALVERGHGFRRHAAEQAHLAGEPEVGGALADLELRPGAVAETHQGRVEVGELAGAGVGLHRRVQVLARLRVADEQHIRTLEPQVAPPAVQLGGRQPLPEHVAHAVVDHLHLSAVDGEVLHEVGARALGHGDDAVGAVERAMDHALGIEEGEPAGQEVRIEEVDDVMDRHHHRRVEDGRRDVVRRMIDVDLQAQEAPGERHQLAQRVDRRRLVNGLEVVRQTAERLPVLRPREEHVAVLEVEPGESMDELAGIGADPGVLEVASIESDRIGQNRLPEATPGF